MCLFKVFGSCDYGDWLRSPKICSWQAGDPGETVLQISVLVWSMKAEERCPQSKTDTYTEFALFPFLFYSSPGRLEGPTLTGEDNVLFSVYQSKHPQKHAQNV